MECRTKSSLPYQTELSFSVPLYGKRTNFWLDLLNLQGPVQISKVSCKHEELWFRIPNTYIKAKHFGVPITLAMRKKGGDVEWNSGLPLTRPPSSQWVKAGVLPSQVQLLQQLQFKLTDNAASHCIRSQGRQCITAEEAAYLEWEGTSVAFVSHRPKLTRCDKARGTLTSFSAHLHRTLKTIFHHVHSPPKIFSFCFVLSFNESTFTHKWLIFEILPKVFPKKLLWNFIRGTQQVGGSHFPPCLPFD